jgi:hypothetical protein
MDSFYHIEGTEYLNNPYQEYNIQDTYPSFQKKLEKFKVNLSQQVNSNSAKTYYKFGDGDYYFLTKSKVGSAKPGNRALKKPYFLINHKKFITNASLNDYYLCEIIKENQIKFNTLFKRDFDFPAEAVYGLIANKWIFNQFSGKIGLIGAEPKIELIKSLMSHQEYREYLGLDKFNDYIPIPQKFAVDKFSKLKRNLEKKIRNSDSSIFLLGVGHVKSGLLSELKNFKDAVFLDIGSGMDAIAGVVNKEKPYFGNWINYQLKDDFDYSTIDYLTDSEVEVDILLRTNS